MKFSIVAAAAMLAMGVAQAGTCFLLAKDQTCAFATDTSGGTVIFTNPTNLSNIGSGVVKPFLGAQNNGTEFGVDTDDLNVATLPLNDKRDNTNTFTNTFTTSQLAVITLNGKTYYEFLLDANEPNGGTDGLISIDTLRLWDAKSAAFQILTNQNVTSLADVDGLFSSLIYALGPNNTLVLNSDLFAGSGLGYDLAMFVPTSLFAGVDPNSRIIFGTGMGALEVAQDGFEEWAFVQGVGAVPEPESYAMMLAGIGLMGFVARRRQNKK
jgi:hypothetical protein